MRSLCRRFRAFIVFFGCVLLYVSCGFDCLFVHTVIVEMPERPDTWSGMGALSYALSWKDETGAERLAFAGEGEALVLRLRRGDPQAILALPSQGQMTFLPAGALYPFDLEPSGGELPSAAPDRLKISFESGYAAATARLIESCGYDPWVYPLEKLKSVNEAKRRDPWALPPGKAAGLLVEGAFRISLFPAPAGSFLLPGDARWWPESPFCRIDSVEGKGDGGQKACLSEGIHLFFSGEEKLVVKVEDREAFLQRVVFIDR